MGNQLTPYLNFDGTCREAVTFYQQVFGGTLEVSTFGQFGMEGPGAEGVMHASLVADDGFVIMASDLPPGMGLPTPVPGNVSVSLSGTDAERLRGYWDGLTSGASISMPLEKQMWGDEFGMLTDRFGIPWLVNIGTGGNQASSQPA